MPCMNCKQEEVYCKCVKPSAPEGRVDNVVKICEDYGCIIGYWSDGYDFQIYTELEKDDFINDSNERFRFKYCPECGRKF